MPVPTKNTTFRSKQILELALLHMAGLSSTQIGKKLHLTPHYVKVLLCSELFKAQVAQLQERLQKEGLQSLINRIALEAPKSLDVATQMRDLPLTEKNAKLARLAKVKFDAAKFLFGDLYYDRKVARLTGSSGKEHEDASVRIVINEAALQSMFTALQEYKERPVSEFPHENRLAIETTSTIVEAELPTAHSRAGERLRKGRQRAKKRGVQQAAALAEALAQQEALAVADA